MKRSKLLGRLKLPEIWLEFNSRGIDTTGKFRSQLDTTFADLCKGIAQFPALLQPKPQETLEALHRLTDYTR